MKKAGQEARPTKRQVDQFRHDQRQVRQPVKLAGALGGITAGGQDACGPLNVQAFPTGLRGHGPSRQAAFEAHLVRDHAFERNHVRWVARGDAVAVQVESNGQVELRPPAQAPVVGQPLEGIHREMQARRFELHGVAKAAQRAGKNAHADVGSAASPDIERR